jgi:MYXO-CTERM domain-containing protein
MRYAVLLVGVISWLSPEVAKATHPCFEDAGPCDCCHGRFDCPPECFADAAGGADGAGGTSTDGGQDGGDTGGRAGTNSGGRSGSGGGAGTSVGGTLGSAGATGSAGAATGGAGGTSAGEDDGGCGCSVPKRDGSTALFAVALLLGLTALRRR